MTPTNVSIAPTADGSCIRVENRGTVRESRIIKSTAAQSLKNDASARVVIDLSACHYADSTFLGCLMDLWKLAGSSGRFAVAAPPEHRKKLLGMARLDTFIPCLDVAPATCGPAVPLSPAATTPREIFQHVLECHRALAEVDCPMRDVFAKIVAQMERELAQNPPT